MSTVLSNPEDRKKLKTIIGEATNCMLRMDGERDAIKEMITGASEQFGIDKKQIRRIAVTMYKHSYADAVAEHEEFELLYESVIEGKQGD